MDSWCSALCDSRYKCDKTYDAVTCVNQCTNNNAAILPKVRSDVVNIDVKCFATLDCATVLAGDSVSECDAKSSSSVAPSPEGQEYCATYISKAAECGGQASEGNCLSYVKIFADGAIREAGRCLNKSCSDADGCLDAALGS